MIDFKRIRQERTGKRIFLELLTNAPQLLLMLYGLKCLATQHGRMLRSVKGEVYSSLQLVSANGTAAVMAGLLYLGFGSFVFLSDGRPPAEDRGWLWRLGRALLRWGSLGLALFCLVKATRPGGGDSRNPHGLPLHLLIEIIAFFVCFFALVLFLLAAFQREQVKRELDDRGCQPLHIWWRPAAYWLPWASYFAATAFRVIYSDNNGIVHKGYCFVYRSFLSERRWGNRRVRWLTDAVTGRSSQ